MSKIVIPVRRTGYHKVNVTLQQDEKAQYHIVEITPVIGGIPSLTGRVTGPFHKLGDVRKVVREWMKDRDHLWFGFLTPPRDVLEQAKADLLVWLAERGVGTDLIAFKVRSRCTFLKTEPNECIHHLILESKLQDEVFTSVLGRIDWTTFTVNN